MLDDDDDDEPYKYKKHQRKNEFGENFLFGGLEIKTHRVQYKGYSYGPRGKHTVL